MAIMLPPELAHVLQLLDFDWPEGNEDEVARYGSEWTAFGKTLSANGSECDAATNEVCSQNYGSAIDAFSAAMADRESPGNTSHDMALGVSIGGQILQLMAGVLIALKVAVIAQLVQFAIVVAQAIASSAVTMGASLAEIPIVKIAVQKAIDFALNAAIEAVLG